MSDDLIERLRNGIGMPTLDDGAFHWYAEITDEAADEIERLRKELAALKAQPAQEPVAWLHSQRFESDVITDKVKNVWGGVAVGREAQYTIPLFRAPQPSAEVEEHAAMYRWLRENPQWIGFDSDYRPDEVDAAVMGAMQKGE